jgi:hypothetical protein
MRADPLQIRTGGSDLERAARAAHGGVRAVAPLWPARALRKKSWLFQEPDTWSLGWSTAGGFTSETPPCRGWGHDERVWLAVAAISLAVATGFNILALAIQDREH